MKQHGLLVFKMALLALLGFYGTCVSSQFQETVSLEKILKGHSHYILNEDLSINIYGVENIPESFQFKRKVVYKIANQKGVQALSILTLPEIFDPTYIAHGSSVKHLGMYFSGVEVRSIEFKISRKNKIFKPKVKKELSEIESFNIDYLYEYDQFHYRINGLEVGDELTVNYHVAIPMQENYSKFTSFRLFFNGEIPKMNYKLSLSHHQSLDIDLQQNFVSKKSEDTKRDRIVYHVWKSQNLPGCINEPGSRPYKSLPHITWVLNQYLYFVHNSQRFENMPHYAIVAASRSPELPAILNSVEIGSKSQQYLPFVNEFERITQGLPQDHTAVKRIHNYVVNEFGYQNDLSYYRRDDNRGERLGDFFQNRMLRDMSRYNLYYAILVKARAEFYTAFVIDKRSAEVSDQYFAPNFDNDFLLASYFGDNLFDFLIPKRERFGWFYNELPFYYEGCLTRLVHISDYALYKYPIKENFRSATTPFQEIEKNQRMVKINADVDLDFDSLYLKGSIQLAGQFSTMTRGTYMHAERDKSINPLYHTPVWRLRGATSKQSEISMIQENSPYGCEVNCAFKVGGRIQKTDQTYTLDLTNFFKHVVPKIPEKSRFLEFYTDFQGKDQWIYQLRFPRPVELIKDQKGKSMANEYGQYIYEFNQVDPLIIEVKSSLNITSDVVSPYDFNDVKEIVEEINAQKYLTIKEL